MGAPERRRTAGSSGGHCAGAAVGEGSVVGGGGVFRVSGTDAEGLSGEVS